MIGTDTSNGQGPPNPSVLMFFSVNNDMTLESGGVSGIAALFASAVDFGAQPNPDTLCLSFTGDPCFTLQVLVTNGVTSFDVTVLSGPAKDTVFSFTESTTSNMNFFGDSC